MESIINAQTTLISNLRSIEAVINSQEEEAGDELAALDVQIHVCVELAEAIREAMKRIEATPAETAALIAGAAREVFGKPIEEETDEQSNRQE